MAGFQDSTSASSERTTRSLSCDDGKRPDGVTLLFGPCLTFSKGKPLAWDVTVPDTYADSHLADTATTAGAAADKSASNKEAKYRQLVAIETAGTWNNQAVELVQELGRRMTAVTEDTRETTYLFQWLSVALHTLFYTMLDPGI